eukprot:CAMPEP_0171667448 /NCGR_PEP_ID=MMETSP0990-20121206/48714_1 /TAXON_ID=483369 /ORGANISM="non described non described, Strain CCMP2098" /LENGTH=30 /DNA_ID= /DNA_START= /DNA_END= /DNA_ORIENTATION=
MALEYAVMFAASLTNADSLNALQSTPLNPL